VPEGHTLHRLARAVDVRFGGRMHTIEEMTRFVELFLQTPFSGETRHRRRIGMLTDYEASGTLPPLPASALRGE